MKQIAKIFLAGICAFALLCIFCFFYSYQSLHHDNPNKNTDYVWDSGSFFFKSTEGFSFGHFDENGYNNPEVIKNPDVLVVGSSHMEGTNIMPDENAAFLLSSLLAGKYSVYNVGISGHTFIKCCQYLPANLTLFYPPENYRNGSFRS